MLRRGLAGARALASIARAYLTEPERRDALRAAAGTERGGAHDSELPSQPPEPPPSVAPVPVGSTPYDGLTSYSTTLLPMRLQQQPPAVNLVLPEIDPDGIFAGVRTALEVGRRAADASGLQLRVLLLKPVDADPVVRASQVARIGERLAELGIEASVLAAEDVPRADFGEQDRWIATHWWTAHAIDVAARSGRIEAARVLYLVQDYEPGFVGWSTDGAVAASTYHAGFTMLVNSLQVAAYLEREGHPQPAAVFGPALDLDELRHVAAGRVRSDRARIFFYARPSKPRNLYGIGIAALRIAAARCVEEGIPFSIVTAGESIGADALPGVEFEDLGTLRREAYFELLERVDVGLSLQASPHPSHPPLDLAVSGAHAVVNELAGARGTLHPSITAVDARPEALADAIVTAARAALERGPAGFAPVDAHRLGGPLDAALETAWRRLR